MQGFNKTKLAVLTGDGRNVRTLEDLVYEKKDGERIIVPRGTESDGATVPQIFWNILPPFGLWWLAAVLHDYLYNYTERPKEYCDDVFLEAMESLNVPLLIRETIYNSVKYGGEIAFTNDRVKELQDAQLDNQHA